MIEWVVRIWVLAIGWVAGREIWRVWICGNAWCILIHGGVCGWSSALGEVMDGLLGRRWY
jgi:hypothetical protein